VRDFIGSLASLNCTAPGKALLALGEADLETTPRRGYVADDEEFSQGIRCVAAPVYAPPGTMIAAIGVSGPTARIDKSRFSELGAFVREQAAIRNFGADNA
jgi:DNA-binding IclR family transcriptional regulator